MSTTPETIKAFINIGFTREEINAATPWHGNALVFKGGRYVAHFGNHGGSGWQVAVGTKPQGRVTLYGEKSTETALAWGRGELSELPTGQACLQGYKVVDGKEMGRKSEEQTETTEVPAASLDQVTINKAQAVLKLMEAGFTREEVLAMFAKA